MPRADKNTKLAGRWLKRGIYILLLAGIVSLAGILALLNQGTVELDLAFAEVSLSKPLAFTVAFGLGWLFGLLCAGGAMLKRRAVKRKSRQDAKGTVPAET